MYIYVYICLHMHSTLYLHWLILILTARSPFGWHDSSSGTVLANESANPIYRPCSSSCYFFFWHASWQLVASMRKQGSRSIDTVVWEVAYVLLYLVFWFPWWTRTDIAYVLPTVMSAFMIIKCRPLHLQWHSKLPWNMRTLFLKHGLYAI
jgi:hypothetical protein